MKPTTMWWRNQQGDNIPVDKMSDEDLGTAMAWVEGQHEMWVGIAHDLSTTMKTDAAKEGVSTALKGLLKDGPEAVAKTCVVRGQAGYQSLCQEQERRSGEVARKNGHHRRTT